MYENNLLDGKMGSLESNPNLPIDRRDCTSGSFKALISHSSILKHHIYLTRKAWIFIIHKRKIKKEKTRRAILFLHSLTYQFSSNGYISDLSLRSDCTEEKEKRKRKYIYYILFKLNFLRLETKRRKIYIKKKNENI
jgi:hypothetical protein